jgi:hypothetical protein
MEVKEGERSTKVRIITESKYSWGVLRRLATEISDRLDYVRIGEPGDAGEEWPADVHVNYFINYALYRELPTCPECGMTHGISMALFTHLEPDPPYHEKFKDVAAKVDYPVAMSHQGQDILKGMGREAPVISPGTSLKKPVKFGVCGMVKKSGRKGEKLVANMAQVFGSSVIAWGEGWPCRTFSNRLEDLSVFYEEIDYLVVTSLNEGGPLPVLEAIGMGVPVIAPDVGFCWEYPVIRYKKGDWHSLLKVLKSLYFAPSWEDWASKHHLLFQQIAEKV